MRCRALLSVVVALAAAAPHGAAAQSAAIEERVASADAQVGEQVARRCRACHTLDENGRHVLGPNLWGVVGRSIAGAEGFKRYSPALKKIDGNWTLTKLSAFLRNPRSYAPGTRMMFAGIKSDQDLADLLAYLQTLGGGDREAKTSSPTHADSTSGRTPETKVEVGRLASGDGREDTAAICAACHSLRLVTQQGLSRARWDELMDWMIEKQGMAPLGTELRQTIVSYLAQHYGPDRAEAGGTRAVDPMRPAMPAMPGMPTPGGEEAPTAPGHAK